LNRLALCAACVLGLAQPCASAEYHVDTSRTNDVRFYSDAPIEDFEGATRLIDGYVYWKGDSLRAGEVYDTSEVYFEVPLAALRTGIDLRDRHMRENYLHTDRHPYVSFKGKIDRVEPHGDTLRVVASGKVDLHGHQKDYVMNCDVSRADGSYRVDAAFDVKLTDFDIEVPSLMFLKINEIIQVKVSFYVKRAA